MRWLPAVLAVAACASEGAGRKPAVAMAVADDRPALMVPEAFIAAFSPDGTRLAYGRSPDNAGVSIRDLKTGASQVLTAKGKTPAWSPDGRWIAYVEGVSGGEELWIVGVDGRDRRRLGQGTGIPLWLADGRLVAREQKRLVVFAPGGQGAPALFYDDVPPFVAVSRDGARLAWGRDEELQIVDRQSRQKLFSWPTPGASALFTQWSPDGKRVAFSGVPGLPVGLWVLDLEKRRAVQLAVGEYMRPVWSPDGEVLAFDLREQKRRSIWRVGRSFVERCLERAGVGDEQLGLGAGLCAEGLRTPATLPAVAQAR
jgi:dipeptidyl aminopeptidase/acylaminoacyl peptidase